ncbi:MAG: hypothetical protein IT520_14060 [Burkholderiales bacterium]|nr:hypothetical protein [Burkholderiales bacterium]
MSVWKRVNRAMRGTSQSDANAVVVVTESAPPAAGDALGGQVDQRERIVRRAIEPGSGLRERERPVDSMEARLPEL